MAKRVKACATGWIDRSPFIAVGNSYEAMDPQPVFFGAADGSTTGYVSSVTLRDTSTSHMFGELAFQDYTGTDIWHLIMDDAFANVEELKLERKGQEVLTCTPLSSTGSDVLTTWSGTRMRLERSGAYPFEYRDTSQALPLGLWRTLISADQWIVSKNTAAAGDFSTSTNFLTCNATGCVVNGLDARTTLGFFNNPGNAQLTVTGSKGGNAALANLITKLSTYGLIVDGTT